MIKWLRSLLRTCDHQWTTRFWGRYTHGVLCLKCSKIEYRDGPSPQAPPPGVSFAPWNDARGVGAPGHDEVP